MVLNNSDKQNQMLSSNAAVNPGSGAAGQNDTAPVFMDESEAAAQIFSSEVDFFLDHVNQNSVYVEYPDASGNLQFASIDGKGFHSFLISRYYELTGKIDCGWYKERLEYCRAHVIYAKDPASMVDLSHRLAGSISSGSIYYALYDTANTVITIDKNGYRTGSPNAVKFPVQVTDSPQDNPNPGDDLLSSLRPYINLPDDDFLLFVLILVQFFSKDSNHFALVISSGKGTGKTTFTNIIKNIVDPSVSQTYLTPTKATDLLNLLSNNYVAPFDNTALLSVDFSNVLCAAVTGTTASIRALYSTCDQTILNLHNVIILNGIDIVPHQPDFIERSLLFELQPISTDKRITASDIHNSFMEKRPAIIAAIFDVLSKAISLYPSTTTKKLHRMADAHRDMLAIGLALGISEDEVNRLIENNVSKMQNSYAVNSSLVQAVLKYFDVTHNSKIENTATDVFDTLNHYLTAGDPFSPKNPSALSRKLHEASDSLHEVGIEFSRENRHGRSWLKLLYLPNSKLNKVQRQERTRNFQNLNNKPTSNSKVLAKFDDIETEEEDDPKEFDDDDIETEDDDD